MTTHSKYLSIPGKHKIDVCLRNHNARQVILPKQTTVGEIVPADMILALLDQRPTEHRGDKKETTTEKRKNEMEWGEQKEAKDLMTEDASIFAMSVMGLGKTSLIKHSIRLTDNTPLKECYQQIPSSMYEEFQEHLKEMLEIDAIWPLHSPWVS